MVVGNTSVPPGNRLTDLFIRLTSNPLREWFCPVSLRQRRIWVTKETISH